MGWNRRLRWTAIHDFTRGQDRLQIDGMTSLRDIVIEDRGDDLLVRYDGGKIYLHDVDTLSVNDFLL